MPDKPFKLEVITPDRVVFSDESIVSVVAPGVEGYIGALANRAPLMTALDVGELDFRRADGTSDSMAVFGGFLEIHENTVTVLAETAEMSEEIDLDRAQRSLERAKERKAHPQTEIDLKRAEMSLKRAIMRIRVAERRT
jgi:F-type H+-transporting ATPase subunit epsilon